MIKKRILLPICFVFFTLLLFFRLSPTSDVPTTSPQQTPDTQSKIKSNEENFNIENFIRLELLKKIFSKKNIGFLIIAYIAWSYYREFLTKKWQRFKDGVTLHDYAFVKNLEKEFNTLKKVPNYWDYEEKIRDKERKKVTESTHEGISGRQNTGAIFLKDKDISAKYEKKIEKYNQSTFNIIKTQLLLLVEQAQKNPKCFIEVLEKMEFIINQYAAGYYSHTFRKFVIPVLQSIYPEILFDKDELKFTTWEEQDAKYIKVVTYFLHVILHDSATEKPLLQKKQISFLLSIADNQNYGCIPWWTHLYQNEILQHAITLSLEENNETQIRKKIQYFSTLFETNYPNFIYLNKSFFNQTIMQDCLSTNEPNKIYLYKKLFKIVCKNVETLFYPFTQLNMGYETANWTNYFHALSSMINNMQEVEKKLYNTTVLSDDFNRKSTQIIKSKLLSEPMCDLSKKTIGIFIKDILFYNPAVVKNMLLSNAFYKRTNYHTLIKFLILLYNDNRLEKKIRKKVKKKTLRNIQEKFNTQKNSKGTSENIVKNDLMLLNYLHFGFNIFKNKKNTTNVLINFLLDLISDKNFSKKVMSTHKNHGSERHACYSSNYQRRINLIMQQLEKINSEYLFDTTKEKICSISYPELYCTYDFVTQLICWMYNIEKKPCDQTYQKNHQARFDIYAYVIKNGSLKENKLYLQNYCFNNILTLITQTDSYYLDASSFSKSYVGFFENFKPHTIEENDRINYIHKFFLFDNSQLKEISKRNIENIYTIAI